MDIQIDERVPRGGHSLMTVFGLPGAVLGYLIWVNGDLIDKAGGDPDPTLLAMIFGLLFGGATYFLTVLKGQIVRSALAGAIVALITGGLYRIGVTAEGGALSDGVLPFLACAVIVTVLLPFLRAASKGNSFFDYRPLYADAWTIPVLVGVAQVFVLVGMLLAALVAALFAFIGLEFLRDLMSEGWFIVTYFGLLEAVGIGVVRQRESAVLAARSIKMALIRVTAPVFAACATVFVGAVMIRGFGSLIEGLSPVGTLTAAAAASIIMINAIVADEGRPQNALFGATARLLGILLVFLMALAVYGLWMRIDSEGLTPNRIVAGVPVLVFALYAPIYAAAALAERWVILRQGNIVMSAVLVAIAVFICTPLFKPYTWSVESQLAIMRAAPEEVTSSDLVYLRDKLGAPGERAFAELRAGQGVLAERAAAIGDRPAYQIRPDETGAPGRVDVFPKDREVPQALKDLALKNIVVEEDAVIVFFEDRPLAMVMHQNYGSLRIAFYREEDGRWTLFTQTALYVPEDREAELMDAARRGEVAFERRSYDVPVIDGSPIPDTFRQLETYRVDEAPTESLGPEEGDAN
ncbi:DUF4153 domain-containing protein [Parvularcula lutaonensis]|uniref:DUF4153 domain-containing protein n=1 Tax=Parvularcula lutaonensis TaxID=491923 RepID=A0ABV7M979_9PROT|nr:DUF4153 domain-containing protein [Parvularcula lutaonensis]